MAKNDERTERILLSIVEKYNIKHPNRKIENELYTILGEHINYAYVAGREDLGRDYKEAITRTLVLNQKVNYNMLISILSKL